MLNPWNYQVEIKPCNILWHHILATSDTKSWWGKKTRTKPIQQIVAAAKTPLLELSPSCGRSEFLGHQRC